MAATRVGGSSRNGESRERVVLAVLPPSPSPSGRRRCRTPIATSTTCDVHMRHRRPARESDCAQTCVHVWQPSRLELHRTPPPRCTRHCCSARHFARPPFDLTPTLLANTVRPETSAVGHREALAAMAASAHARPTCTSIRARWPSGKLACAAASPIPTRDARLLAGKGGGGCSCGCCGGRRGDGA